MKGIWLTDEGSTKVAYDEPEARSHEQPISSCWVPNFPSVPVTIDGAHRALTLSASISALIPPAHGNSHYQEPWWLEVWILSIYRVLTVLELAHKHKSRSGSYSSNETCRLFFLQTLRLSAETRVVLTCE